MITASLFQFAYRVTPGDLSRGSGPGAQADHSFRAPTPLLGQTETWTHDSLGQETNFVDFDGNETDYTLYGTGSTDGSPGQLEAKTVKYPSGTAYETVTYEYNQSYTPQGSYQDIVDDSLCGITTSSYDVNGNLVELQSPQGTINYTYDPAAGEEIGVSTSNTDTQYGYDQADEMTSVTVTELQGATLATPLVTSCSYDADGNTLTVTGSGSASSATYTWDPRGRMIGATTGGNTVSYQYNDSDDRIAETVNDQTTKFLNDPNQAYDQVLEEYAQSGVLAATYISGIDLLFEDQIQNGVGTLSYYATDNLASTRALTSSAGAVTDTFSYDAYGNLIASSGMPVNPYLFTGQRFDAAIGQYYLRARAYSPLNGDFSSRDSYDGQTDDPITLNHHTYAGGDPIGNIDPSGHEFSASGLTATIGATIVLGGLTVASGLGWIGRQSAPGAGSLIPFVGSGSAYLYYLQQGNYGMASVYAGLLVSDASLLRSVANAAGAAPSATKFPVPGTVVLVPGIWGTGYRATRHFLWEVGGEFFDVLKTAGCVRINAIGVNIPKLFMQTSGTLRLPSLFPQLARPVGSYFPGLVPFPCLTSALFYWDRANAHTVSKALVLLLWYPFRKDPDVIVINQNNAGAN